MTPSQKEWRELQKQVHILQEKSMTLDEKRQLAEVLTIIETYLYLPELSIISSDRQENPQSGSLISIYQGKPKIGL